ncbi:MAG: hypothetical protein C0600_14590 [Ignavibacteria bacterium]|nr:MAG: hypothetical protein C0600_14590 [Ignavibacteria bacterium]
MTKRLLLICALCFPMLAAAQPSQIQVSIDMAAFQYDKETSYVEMYYSFPRSVLEYSLVNGRYDGAAVLHSIIRNLDEEAEQDPILKSWRVPISVEDTTGMLEKTLIGKVNFLLEPGRYSFTVVTRDEKRPLISDSVSIPFEVRDFSTRAVKYSDLELASSIERKEMDDGNIFYKNTLEVIPNPTLLYGKQLPNVLYYIELYKADREQFLVKSEIVSSYGKTMSSKVRARKGKHDSRVEVGSMNVSPLPTGVYTLILSYGDTAGDYLHSQSKAFYVFNPDIPLDTLEASAIADLIAAEFSAMAEDELDEQYAMANYIATSEESNIYEALTGSEAKKKFLTKFWRDRDPDPATPINEFYQEYRQRIAICSEQFRTAYRSGWRSDRGRVYMLYGPPDYVERLSSESDMKPHEIWRYDAIEGGVDFIFVDRGGFSSYELVHSTKRNEIYNPDWERTAGTY